MYSTASVFVGEEAAAENDPKPRPRRLRRRCVICCASWAALFTVSIVTTLLVSIVLFKIRDPTMRFNSFKFNHQLDLTQNRNQNLTITADVSVKNPNAVTFTFKSSRTALLYRSRVVGLAYGPPGTVRAHRTLRADMTVDVNTERLLNDSELVKDVLTLGGAVRLETSTTVVGGRVKVLGMFNHRVDVVMNCTLNVSVVTQSILDQRCTQHMWL